MLNYQPPQKILRAKAAAFYLGVSLSSLKQSSKLRAIPYVQLTSRAKGWLRSDLDAYLEKNRRGAK